MSGIRHGGHGTRLHEVWRGMLRRCRCKRGKSFKYYAGRGITFCPEWADFTVFRAWALANGYRDDLSLEREDVNGNYEPANCTWIPLADQKRNTRRQLRDEAGRPWVVTAVQNGIQPQMYAQRVWRGWSPEQASSTPKGVRRHGRL